MLLSPFLIVGQRRVEGRNALLAWLPCRAVGTGAENPSEQELGAAALCRKGLALGSSLHTQDTAQHGNWKLKPLASWKRGFNPWRVSYSCV